MGSREHARIRVVHSGGGVGGEYVELIVVKGKRLSFYEHSSDDSFGNAAIFTMVTPPSCSLTPLKEMKMERSPPHPFWAVGARVVRLGVVVESSEMMMWMMGPKKER